MRDLVVTSNGYAIVTDGGVLKPATDRNEVSTVIPETLESWQRSPIWNAPMWNPSDPSFAPGDLYKDIKELMIKVVLFSDPAHYVFYVLWILQTWKMESFDSVAFPSFSSYRRNTGKSTALDFGASLSYRGVNCSSITFAAIPRLTDMYDATIFIDELQSKIIDKQDGQKYRDFLKTSYTRGKHYITADNNNQKKLCVLKNFGPKAFASEKPLDEGVLERCVPIQMLEGRPQIKNLGRIRPQISKLLGRLIRWRYIGPTPKPLPEDFPLYGRVYQLFESILMISTIVEIPEDDLFLLKRLIQETMNEKEQRYKNTDTYDVIEMLKSLLVQHKHAKDGEPNAEKRIKIKTLCELSNFEGDKGPGKMGYILKSLGIITIKDSEGNKVLEWNDKTKSIVERLEKPFTGTETTDHIIGGEPISNSISYKVKDKRSTYYKE